MSLLDIPIEQKLNVFSKIRVQTESLFNNPIKNKEIKINFKNEINGLTLLQGINENTITAVFFDPQYRGIMDKMNYGNEGKRQIQRALLNQMNDELIIDFIKEIDKILINSGHLFLWVDKFHVCQGVEKWIKNTRLSIVDLITWDKGKIGMGYRTRRKTEYLLVIQKLPIRAKGVWSNHSIPDVWTEKIVSKIHPHQKPIELQKILIEAVSLEMDYILDPCSGSYSVFDACKMINRNFIGGDLINI